MQLREYLRPEFVVDDLAARSKTEALRELAEPACRIFPGLDLNQVTRVLLERENLGTTGIGDGLAIPHGKLAGLDAVAIVAGRSLAGVDFAALDFKPCHIFFLVLAPDKVVGLHLRILAQISRLLSDDSFKQGFLGARGTGALWSFLKDY